MLRIPTRRTWAPEGPPPIIADHDTHDRISALAALTLAPPRQPLGLSLRFQPHTCQARHVADFRRALVPHLRGPLLVRWDRGSIPRGPALEAVYQAHPRLPLEAFPAYAPERNPTAQVWNDVTGHLANSLRQDTRELRRRLAANSRRVRRSQAKLRSCIRRSQLPSPP